MSVRTSSTNAAINYGWGMHPEYTMDPPYGYPPTSAYNPRSYALLGGSHQHLRKRSKAMKAYMAYIRSLRGRKRGRKTAHKRKGSEAAKKYMAYVRTYLKLAKKLGVVN